MSSQPQSDPAEVSSAPEWRRHLVVITCGVFLFLLLSGLLITLMPFGLTTQFLVLFHTGAGLAFIPLYVVYQVRHWLRFHGKTLTNIKYLGYTTLVATLISLVSGVWVTADAALGTKLDPLMDDLHLILSLVAGAILIWHLVLVLRLQRAWPDPETRAAYRGSHSAFFGRISGVAAALLIAVLGAGAIYHFTDIPTEDYSIPDDYVFKYGDNPFAPSLAMTADGGAVDPRLLAYSRRCGESGCHEQILKEWLPSAHRYSSMDLAFQAVQHLMAENEGPESTRYCAGCHDPIALFSGSKNLYNEDLSSFGADEGISCLVCHSITQADVKGNANYTLERPVPYAFALHDGPAAAFLSRFLVRSYPDYHVSSYKRELYKTPEFCGACHKQFIDQEINKVGWVQLQNQYDNWKASLWNRSEDPAKKITCNECHMRLMDSEDPGSGDDLDYNRSPDDGKTRHHGYIAANQFIPLAHGLEGAEEHVRLVEEWLKGETVIPEIADKWRGGPVVSVRVMPPEQARAGEPLDFRVVVHNSKVGHDFPTGPLDIIQAWVEVVVKDDRGQEVFRSGTPTPENFLPEGTFVFKAEGIDKEGNLIDRHNLWEMVGARFKRALFPDYSDSAQYQLLCPSFDDKPGEEKLPGDQAFTVEKAPVGELTIEARVLYRKFDQYLLNYMGNEGKVTAPVTEMATDRALVTVVP